MGRITRKEQNLLGRTAGRRKFDCFNPLLARVSLVDELLKRDLAKYSLWVLRVYGALSTPVSSIQLRFTHCSTMAVSAEFAFF